MTIQTAPPLSSKHPHEPEIPPALDPEGRCLVCGLLAQVEEYTKLTDLLQSDIAQIRRSAGLFDGALPVTPREALFEAVDVMAARIAELEDAARTALENRDLLRHDDHTGTCAACWVEGTLNKALGALGG